MNDTSSFLSVGKLADALNIPRMNSETDDTAYHTGDTATNESIYPKPVLQDGAKAEMQTPTLTKDPLNV